MNRVEGFGVAIIAGVVLGHSVSDGLTVTSVWTAIGCILIVVGGRKGDKT